MHNYTCTLLGRAAVTGKEHDQRNASAACVQLAATYLARAHHGIAIVSAGKARHRQKH